MVLWYEKVAHGTVTTSSERRLHLQRGNLHDVTSERLQLLLHVQPGDVSWGRRMKTWISEQSAERAVTSVTSVLTEVFLQDHFAAGVQGVCCFPQFPHGHVFLETRRRQSPRYDRWSELLILIRLTSKHLHTTITGAGVIGSSEKYSQNKILIEHIPVTNIGEKNHKSDRWSTAFGHMWSKSRQTASLARHLMLHCYFKHYYFWHTMFERL